MAFVRSRYNKTAGVKTNLYTKGGEYADPTMAVANQYTGPYYTIYGIFWNPFYICRSKRGCRWFWKYSKDAKVY